MPKPICPLCRTGFEAGDIRKLHIDRGLTPRISLMTSTDPFGDSDVDSFQEARRYQTDITRIVKQGAPASKLRVLIDECHIWLKSQPHDQVITFFPVYLPMVDVLLDSGSMRISASVFCFCTT